MLASILILAQRGTQEPPDEGIGIGLILLAFLFVILVAAAILFAFRTYSKKTRETGPSDTPHKQGHVGSGGGA
jgi:flagellar basal body-associated protein FliL